MGKKQHAKDKLYILHTEWKCGRRLPRTIAPKLSNHSLTLHSSAIQMHSIIRSLHSCRVTSTAGMSTAGSKETSLGDGCACREPPLAFNRENRIVLLFFASIARLQRQRRNAMEQVQDPAVPLLRADAAGFQRRDVSVTAPISNAISRRTAHIHA